MTAPSFNKVGHFSIGGVGQFCIGGDILTIGLLLPVTSAWANETKKAQPTKASAQEFIKTMLLRQEIKPFFKDLVTSAVTSTGNDCQTTIVAYNKKESRYTFVINWDKISEITIPDSRNRNISEVVIKGSIKHNSSTVASLDLISPAKSDALIARIKAAADFLHQACDTTADFGF